LRKALTIAGIALALAAAVFFYLRWLKNQEKSAWDFIPRSSALVLESSKLLVDYDKLSGTTIGKSLNTLPQWKRANRWLTSLDSIQRGSSIRAVFDGAITLIAVFPTTANDLDALIVVKAVNAEQRRWLRKALQYPQDQLMPFKTRHFYGFDLLEVSLPDNQVFTFFLAGDVLVGSFTTFLVEDAIRAHNSPGSQSFKSVFNPLFSLSQIRLDDGNLYLNFEAIKSLFNLAANQEVETIAQSAYLDVSVNDQYLKLTGFTFAGNEFLSSFSTNSGPLDIFDLVPMNTAILQHYSFDQIDKWRTELGKKDSSIHAASRRLRSAHDIQIEGLIEHLDNEVAWTQLELLQGNEPNHLLFIKSKNISKSSDFMLMAARRISIDSVFSDKQGEYTFYKLENPIVLEALIGKQNKFQGESYFMEFRNFLVVSNSLTELRRFIQSVETENTWRKSLRYNRMMEQASREANYSLFVNMPRFWPYLIQRIKPEWQEFFIKNASWFQSFETVSAQYGLIDNKFYTNILAYQPDVPKQQATTVSVPREGSRLALPSRLITKPFLIRGHVNQAMEMFVQDSLLQVYHISPEFEIIWSKMLGEKIQGNILPVDYYLNNKIQYAFATSSALHIIDRTGNYIDGFPVKVGNQPITHFSVVDYDGSKNYRFMLTDNKGNVFILDKSGRALEGWSPKAIGHSLHAAPRHIRVAGKDAFVLIRPDGVVDLLSRKGTSYPDFPVQLKTELVAAFFTEATGNFNTSRLTTLSTSGELIRVNFSGKTELREQLVKSDTETKYQLISDVSESTYIIVRQSFGAWEILDSKGNMLFEKNYMGESEKLVQYYRFGGNRSIIATIDPKENSLNLFDLAGNPLTTRPLNSQNPVSIMFSERTNTYTVFFTNGYHLEKVEIGN
jgi:hypothetical protein